RSQREIAEALVARQDRPVRCVRPGEMHHDRGQDVLPDPAAAADDDLKLVHIMEVGVDGSSGLLLNEEGLRGADLSGLRFDKLRPSGATGIYRARIDRRRRRTKEVGAPDSGTFR